MKYCGLIFYQALILFAFYRFGFGEESDHDLEAELVRIHMDSTDERSWGPVFLSKNVVLDEFMFVNQEIYEICGGVFTSYDVEIVEVFGTSVRFFLLTQEMKKLLVNVIFAKERSVQLFFRYIRSQQPRRCGRENMVDKLIQYRTDDSQNDDERLEKIADYAVTYSKYMNDNMPAGQTTFILAASGTKMSSFANTGQRTINFTKYNPNVIDQNEVYLVLLSKTFNISEKIRGSNIYVLCPSNFIGYKFILVLRNSTVANHFLYSVKNHVDHELPCPTEWLSPEILQKIQWL